MIDRYDTSAVWQQAKESLNHVFWIGGATTAGKSTISTKLANDFDMVHYSSDLSLQEHIARATEEYFPAICAAAKGGMEYFRMLLLQPPEKIAEMRKSFLRESVIMAVEDLLALPAKKPIVADMFFGETIGDSKQLLDYDKSVFLVPTEKFHRVEYQGRFRHDWKPFFRQALEGCPDQETIFMQGWAQYHIDYGHYVREQCRKHNLCVMITGGQADLEESYRAVCNHFKLSITSE